MHLLKYNNLHFYFIANYYLIKVKINSINQLIK
jgi:hypothetical protein